MVAATRYGASCSWNEGANPTCEVTNQSSFMGVCWTGLPEDLCANHTGRGTNHTLERNLPLRTDSLVGRALVMIVDDAGSIPAQSTISMTFGD
jgi:hypothetical protein